MEITSAVLLYIHFPSALRSLIADQLLVDLVRSVLPTYLHAMGRTRSLGAGIHAAQSNSANCVDSGLSNVPSLCYGKQADLSTQGERPERRSASEARR